VLVIGRGNLESIIALKHKLCDPEKESECIGELARIARQPICLKITLPSCRKAIGARRQLSRAWVSAITSGGNYERGSATALSTASGKAATSKL
jgi:hypothetical protein